MEGVESQAGRREPGTITLSMHSNSPQFAGARAQEACNT